MILRPHNSALPLAESLRERAVIALDFAWTRRRAFVPGLSGRPFLRFILLEGRKALALLRAADKIDARVVDGPCIHCGAYTHHDAGCSHIRPSDGLHYADGQLFNVNAGRPEAL